MISEVKNKDNYVPCSFYGCEPIERLFLILILVLLLRSFLPPLKMSHSVSPTCSSKPQSPDHNIPPAPSPTTPPSPTPFYLPLAPPPSYHLPPLPICPTTKPPCHHPSDFDRSHPSPSLTPPSPFPSRNAPSTTPTRCSLRLLPGSLLLPSRPMVPRSRPCNGRLYHVWRRHESYQALTHQAWHRLCNSSRHSVQPSFFTNACHSCLALWLRCQFLRWFT